jgi:hypothetical protein
MTDNARGSLGPPWSVDLLADLHAGVLDPDESARLWPQVNADPEARAVLEALDTVKVDLGQLGQAPVEPMPARFAAELDAAIAAEAKTMRGSVATATPPAPQQAPVVDLAAARKRRNRMAAWSAGVLTAAAAAVGIAFVAFPGGDSTTGTPEAADTPTQTEAPGAGAPPPVALTRENLSPAISELSGEKDYGPFGDEASLQECLDTHSEVGDGDIVGVGPVTLDGAEAVGVLLGAGQGGDAGQFQVVVVSAPDCQLLTQATLGG